MNIEIKKSKKPVKYNDALKLMEERLLKIDKNDSNELIWILEHEDVYTAGTSYQENEVIDKTVKILKTNRGGKITYHGPGQLVCYFVIDLRKRKKDIRKFISAIEKSIIHTLKEVNIKSFNDRKNVGIWTNYDNKIKKIAAIGIRVKKWIAFHGFSLNYSNSLEEYKKIIPCGINDKGVININKIRKVSKTEILRKLEKNLLNYLDY